MHKKKICQNESFKNIQTLAQSNYKTNKQQKKKKINTNKNPVSIHIQIIKATIRRKKNSLNE